MTVLNKMTSSEILADWIVSCRERDFSEDVLQTAQTFVLDWVANALAGRGTIPGHSVLDYARSQPEGVSRIIGEPRGCPVETAAFVNGALSHIVEMDDVDRISVMHPGAVVIPAALAVAERDNQDGRDFLSAVVAGYEIAIRIGSAVGRKHYFHFHNTSTCGVFGAAVAAGWLRKLSKEALVWTLGNAGTMASGVWEFNTDGAMSKHLHAGHASASGIRAADLAAFGFTGARSIFEGSRGFFSAMAPEGDINRVTEGLGEDDLLLPFVSLKPYPSCRHTHAVIDAAIALRKQLQGKTVRKLKVYVYKAASDLCDNPTPQTPYEAKFSLQYCASRAFYFGSVGLADFDLQMVKDFKETIQVGIDPRLDAMFPMKFPARLEVILDDGSSVVKEVLSPLGDPENPLSLAQVELKLMELSRFGGVEHKQATEYLEWVRCLLSLSGDKIA